MFVCYDAVLMSNITSIPSVLSIARLITAVNALPSARFVGFTYRAKESGELANHVLIVGASYENTLRASVEQLNALLPSLSGIDAIAGAELAASLAKSLACMAAGIENPDYTKAGLYEAICPGVKYSKADGTLEVAGLAHSKTVIERGTYKSVNSSAKTLAKAALRSALPIGKFRTFCLDVGCLDSVRISGEAIQF